MTLRVLLLNAGGLLVHRVTFALRDGTGDIVPKAPWKCEWGGGSSIENPHVQRVQYCDLLVSGDNTHYA